MHYNSVDFYWCGFSRWFYVENVTTRSSFFFEFPVAKFPSCDAILLSTENLSGSNSWNVLYALRKYEHFSLSLNLHLSLVVVFHQQRLISDGLVAIPHTFPIAHSGVKKSIFSWNSYTKTFRENTSINYILKAIIFRMHFYILSFFYTYLLDQFMKQWIKNSCTGL